MGTFTIDTTLTPDYTEGGTFEKTTMNTSKNEIVSKHNAAYHLSTGHQHDGTDSPYLSGYHISFTEFERLVIMGVLK